MERCIWWVFIYPVAMHGPCGHVCAKVAPFTWLLSHDHPHINNTAPFDHPQPPLHTQTTTTMDSKPPDQPNRWTATTGSEPPDQPNGRMTTMDGNQLVNGHATMSRWWRHMLSSLPINLGEDHASPPRLLSSHENQGAMSPSAMWQLTLGFLLLTTLPTPGLCPMLPLRASACRVAMDSFI